MAGHLPSCWYPTARVFCEKIQIKCRQISTNHLNVFISERFLQNFEQLKRDMFFIKRTVQEIQKQQKAGDEIDVEDVIDDLFPLETEEALKSLEDKLTDPKYRKKMVSLHVCNFVAKRRDTLKLLLCRK